VGKILDSQGKITQHTRVVRLHSTRCQSELLSLFWDVSLRPFKNFNLKMSTYCGTCSFQLAFNDKSSLHSKNNKQWSRSLPGFRFYLYYLGLRSCHKIRLDHSFILIFPLFLAKYRSNNSAREFFDCS
jgi:hypothetical protein